MDNFHMLGVTIKDGWGGDHMLIAPPPHIAAMTGAEMNKSIKFVWPQANKNNNIQYI